MVQIFHTQFLKQSMFEASEALQKPEGPKKIKTTLFHWYSWNSEVETTWNSLICWRHRTSKLLIDLLIVYYILFFVCLIVFLSPNLSLFVINTIHFACIVCLSSFSNNLLCLLPIFSTLLALNVFSKKHFFFVCLI